MTRVTVAVIVWWTLTLLALLLVRGFRKITRLTADAILEFRVTSRADCLTRLQLILAPRWRRTRSRFFPRSYLWGQCGSGSAESASAFNLAQPGAVSV